MLFIRYDNKLSFSIVLLKCPLSQSSDVEQDVIPALEEPRGQGDFFDAPTTLCIHPCMGRRAGGHQKKLPWLVTRADIAG